MTALQTILLGTPPSGSDGDAVRTASTKFNSNVAVLQSQAALSSGPLLTSAQTLTTAHIGKRINISLAAPGAIAMPLASQCGADTVILLRNIGATVVTLAPFATSGDTVSLSKLNPGEVALMDVDGVHTWSVLMRGRTNSDNEVVNGNCTVNGSETVIGNLSVNGTLFTSAVSATTISASGAYSGASAGYTGNVTVGGTLGVTGLATFTQRPTFAGKAPWDAGNLVNPTTSANGTPVQFNWRTIGGAATLGLSIGATDIGNLISCNSAYAVSFTWTGAGLDMYIGSTRIGKVTTS